MIMLDGKTPVYVSWRGKWSAEVASLDGSLIITNEMGDFVSARPDGFVKVERLVEIPDPECTCQPDDAMACPACVAMARKLYPEELPY